MILDIGYGLGKFRYTVPYIGQPASYIFFLVIMNIPALNLAFPIIISYKERLIFDYYNQMHIFYNRFLIFFAFHRQQYSSMDPENNTVSQSSPQKIEAQQQVDPDMPDDDDDLNLFHKSSLRDKEQLPLPEIVPQTYNVKRVHTETGEMKVKDYVQICKLGEGAFAEVKKVRQSNIDYAMKVYSLLKLKSRKFYAADGSFADSQQMFRNQVQILKCLNHFNLAKCHQILYGGHYAYVVMQLCDLGQIMNWSHQKNNFIRNNEVVQYIRNKYSANTLQQQCRIIFLQAALAVEYLHKQQISNRDIKVDNILCKRTESQGNDIKLADFTTVRYSKDDISYFSCGTAGFRAPEIQNCSSQGYSCKAHDIWGLGISMYTFYFQNFPFMGESQYEIEARAEKEELAYSQNCPTWLKQLISQMTKKRQVQRIRIEEVINLLTHSANI